MRRRTLLSLAGASALPLAGCTDDSDPDDAGGGTTPTTDGEDGTATPDDGRDDLPENCPTTQDLDVEWPTELDAETVTSFVEAYEAAYYREVVVGFEAENEYEEYGLSGDVTGPPEETGTGWTLHYSGSGGVYRPNLLLEAATVEAAPDGVDVVPYADVEDNGLRAVLDEAAEAGEAEDHLGIGGAELAAHLESFAALSSDFEVPSSRGDSGTLYVDVDGAVVAVEVYVTTLHGDYWWGAWYYVDEHVVRRTEDEETDPRNGQLLECREG